MSCNVVVIQKGDVLSTFERAIAAFSRPMDPDYVEGDQQVRAAALSKCVIIVQCFKGVCQKTNGP
jgi:hypothetical protein